MFRRLCCFRLTIVLENCHSDTLHNISRHKLATVFQNSMCEISFMTRFISNVVNVSLSSGSLGYWTACNTFKRYCTLSYCVNVISMFQRKNICLFYLYHRNAACIMFIYVLLSKYQKVFFRNCINLTNDVYEESPPKIWKGAETACWRLETTTCKQTSRYFSSNAQHNIWLWRTG